MSWLNLNESLNNIKGQISSFASGVLADGTVNDTDPFTELSLANKKIQELQNLCASQDVEIASLRRQNAEYYEKLSFGNKNKNDIQESSGGSNGENWFWDPPSSEVHAREQAQRKNSTNSAISDLTSRINELEIEKQDLVQSLEQLDQDCQRTTDKLVTLKDNLQSDYSKLKIDFDSLKLENESLIQDNFKYKQELNKLAEDLQILKLKNNSTHLDKVDNNHNKSYEELESKYNNVLKYQNLYDDLKSIHDEMHKKYVSILKETVKKYVDYTIPDEFVQKQNESPQVSEFNSKVEAVLKLLLDFKWKTETLERKLCEISHEKTVAITEKNHEIEKLLHNSEILSQEVITKTQTIKHYEMECSELIKNNDLLIAELQQYKNNNGLQTISESNEDNLLLMETQLENANKRIRELELVINDMENAKQDVALETQTELDYIKKQLNMTGKELSQSKKEYQDLLKHFKQYEVDNQNLTTELNTLQSTCNNYKLETQHLETLMEKMKSEMENTEYKYNETNMDLSSIHEELQQTKLKCENLANTHDHISSINKDYENKIHLMQEEIDSLKTKLENSNSIRQQMEQHNRSLSEKLQSSKMCETGLKLQIDQIKKELETFTEVNSNLERKTQKYNNDFLEISKAFLDLKESTTLLKDFTIQDGNQPILQKLELLKNHLKNLESNFTIENNKKDNLEENNILFENKLKELQNQIEHLESEKILLEDEINTLKKENEDFSIYKQQSESSNIKIQDLNSKISFLENEITNLNTSKAEILNLITVKHQENIQYHSEIQRLNQIISAEAEKYKNLEQQFNNHTTVNNSKHLDEKLAEIEKLTDQNGFLKEKCERLSQNLLEEQSNSQKILSELERLRMHLVTMEDYYTKELLQAEQKNTEMLSKVNEIEQRERDSSTIYTSVSIRANQQVETLQNQLQLVTTQRDDLQKKISEAEDKNNKQFAALTNLQCVLEQFQRDREKDILSETERIRRQIDVEKQKQDDLQGEINMLKSQLEESKQGLKAAARLTEQMEKSKSQVLVMKEEVTKLQDQLIKSEEKYKQLTSKTNATVEKSLIKNLVIGFINCNNNLTKDQHQILKIIATVLDFNQQDNEKLKLNKPASDSWLSSILHPQAVASSSMTQQSLSEAFVRFLETESQPKPAPTPLINVRKMSTESNTSNSSSSRHTPILLNEVVLPTFADFAQNRNSSSILKDVLKEN